MADEVIGSAAVQIVGDYSSLQADIDAAANVAAQGGEQIAEALNAGADGADTLTSALDEAVASCQTFEQAIQAAIDGGATLAEALQAVTTSAAEVSSGMDQAAQSAESAAASTEQQTNSLQDLYNAAIAADEALHQTAEAESEVAESSEEAAEGVHTLYGSMIEVAEALAITEGFREFAAEALNASDTVTKASIALTQLTGDAEKATSTIEELEAVGIQDGLALPNVLTAATRMQALLGAAAPVPELMAKIADGAAAMNTPIEAAVNAFDRMASSGTLAARQLPSIGLSLQGIAAALNEVDPAAEATADNITKLFKDLDQTDRLEVLTTAFEKFGGVAQQVAQQTFGGEWQSLADQWEQTMTSVGQALQPVTAAMLAFASTNILPAIKGIVDTFAELPQPLQEAAIALVALVPIFAAVIGAVGAAGIAMIGVREAGVTLSEMLAGLGIASAEAAAGEGAATVAAEAQAAADVAATLAANELAAAETATGEAATAAAAEITTAGTAAETTGTALSGIASGALPAIAAALIAGIALWTDYQTKFGQMNTMVAASDKAFQSYMQTLVSGAQTAQQMSDAQDKINIALANGLITQQQATDATKKLEAEQKGLVGTSYAATEAMNGINISLVPYSSLLQGAATAAQVAGAAQQGLGLQMQSLQHDVTAASNALVQAQQAVNATTAGTKEHQDAVNALGAAYQDWKNATGALATAQAALASQVSITSGAVRSFIAPAGVPFADAMTAAADKTAGLTAQLNAQQLKLAEDQAVLSTWVQGLQNGEDVLVDVSKWTQQVLKDQQALNATQEQLGQSQKDVNAAFTAAKLTTIDWTAGLDAATAAAQALGIGTDNLTTADAAFYAGLKTLKITLDDVGESISKQVAAYEAIATSSKDTLATEDAGWAKVSATLTKLSQTDLPQVIALYNQHIAQLEKLGATQGEILTNQANLLTAEIKYAEQTGTDATAQVVALNNVKLAQQALADNATLMGNTIVGVQMDIIHGFENMGQSIAQTIVEGGNMGQTFIKIGEQIAESILTTIINGAMKALINSIIEATTDVAGLGKAFSSMVSTASSAIGTAGQAAGQAAGAAGNAAGAAGAAAGASAATGLIGAIGSIGSMIAGIVGDIQTAHTQQILGQIEQNTRYLQIEAQQYFQQDSWAMQTGIVQTLDMIFNRLGDMWNTLTTIMQAATATTGGGGGNDQLSAIFDQISQEYATLNQTLSGLTSSAFANTITNAFTQANQIIANEMIAQFNVVQPLLQGISTQLTGIFTALTNIPKLASGTDYVPHDMLAYIHEGEAVLPKGFTMPTVPGGQISLAAPGSATYNSTSSTGASGNVGNVTFNVYQSSSPTETVRQIANTLKTLSPKFAVLSN